MNNESDLLKKRSEFDGLAVPSGNGTEKTACLPCLTETLSTREKEILRLMALGYTSSEIARQLHIQAATVNTHRRNMIDRTRVRNSAELIFRACKAGLLGE